MHTCWTEAKYVTNALYAYTAWCGLNAAYMVHPETLTLHARPSDVNPQHGALCPEP